ncbi:MAG TPA: hypothetical protein VM580_01465 [Labilithrix sp.]|nr:hypothetical protein [Labilithrix sp.]
MSLNAILSDDARVRAAALAAAVSAPERERWGLATKLAVIAKESATALAEADVSSKEAAMQAAQLARSSIALANLRVDVGKSALMRIADEGTPVVKAALARALRETTSPEGRAVLVYFLSDDEARGDAILAIGDAPWPEVLPALIEVAEGDEYSARLAARAIAKCGATAGPKEAAAAADFLLEQLEYDGLFTLALDSLLRFGAGFPGVAARGKRLAKEPGKRKVAGLCLVAAFGDEGNAAFLELALGTRTDEDAARAFLGPLLRDSDDRIRAAAERTWKALDLR